MISFNTLLDGLIDKIAIDFIVSGLALDSRSVKKDNVFIALSGTQNHGMSYATQAVKNGACAILVEDNSDTNFLSNVPCFEVKNLSQKLSMIAAKFYQSHSQYLTTVATTGTNGKSSITYGLADIFDNHFGKTGVVGTLGFGLNNQLHSTTHTTPNAIKIQQISKQILDENAKYLMIEASSHGLLQGRINAVNVGTAIYTNLSHEHLDYHHSMNEYFEAKRLLFLMPSVKNAVVNFNDEFGQKLISEFNNKLRIITYGIAIPNKGEFLSADNIKITTTGYEFLLKSSWGQALLQINLLGVFNIENVLAMLGAYLLHGGKFEKLPEIVGEIKALDGRMQCFGGIDNPLVVVDFSHTPDALSKVLRALRAHMQQNADLYCVFGCGGNRDKGKRPLMAKVAEQLADFVIITDDNPRDESSQTIIGGIVDGFSDTSKVTIIQDRKEAIHQTVKLASKTDVVLVAGKGHETHQIINGKMFDFSDKIEVQKALC